MGYIYAHKYLVLGHEHVNSTPNPTIANREPSRFGDRGFAVVGLAWTPKVCKIMAFMADIMGLGLLFYILLGSRCLKFDNFRFRLKSLGRVLRLPIAAHEALGHKIAP